MNNQVIDIFDLARQEKKLDGEFDLALFPRLLAGLPEQKPGAKAVWSIRGRATVANELFVDLSLSAPLVLECQRCLQPFEWQARVDHTLQVVTDGQSDGQGLGQQESGRKDSWQRDSWEQVAGGSDDLDIDEIEQITGSHRFDLAGLLEDELILSVPYVPKHVQCPSAHPALEADGSALSGQVERPRPFAILGKLKGKS